MSFGSPSYFCPRYLEGNSMSITKKPEMCVCVSKDLSALQRHYTTVYVLCTHTHTYIYIHIQISVLFLQIWGWGLTKPLYRWDGTYTNICVHMDIWFFLLQIIRGPSQSPYIEKAFEASVNFVCIEGVS